MRHLLTLIACLLGMQLLAQSAEISQKNYVIDSIYVRGNTLYAAKDIIAVTGLSTGSIITIPSNDTKDAINSLWDQKLFSDINIYMNVVDTVADRVHLIIDVEEMNFISKYDFIGIDEDEAEDMKEALNLTEGLKYSQILYDRIEKHIKSYLITEGYYKGTYEIKPIFKEVEGRKSIVLKIAIDTKEDVDISQIKFVGNTYFSDFWLRWAMDETRETSIWNWFVSSDFNPELYQADLDIIRNKYNEEGFRNMKITKDSIYYDAEGDMVIEIHISEGKQFYFNDITFVGNTVYDQEHLQDVFGIQSGDIYNTTKLNEQIGPGQSGQDLMTLYQDNGYLFAQVKAREKSVNNDSINLEIRIREGDQARYKRVTIKGNTRTNDNVIYRELRTKPGDLFSRTAIKESIRELGALGFFNPQTIRPDVVPNPADGTVDLTYNVEFQSSSRLELQGGYGANSFIGSVGFSFNNFAAADMFNGDEWKPVPMGDAQKLSLRYERSRFTDVFSFTFSEPWFGGDKRRGLSVGLNASRYKSFGNFFQNNINPALRNRTQQLPTDADVDGTMDILGLNLGLSERLAWPDYFFSLSNSLSLRMYDLNNYNSGFFTFDKGRAYDLSYRVALVRNSAGPNPFFPTGGAEIGVTGAFTPPYSVLNPDVNDVKWLEFYKLKYTSKIYTNIWDKLVLRSSYEMGWLDSYSNNASPSPFERFSLGGNGFQGTSFLAAEIIPLRGYENNSLTPAGGARVYSKFGLEMRYPVLLEAQASVFALGFFEGAKAWARAKDFSPFDSFQSAGGGVRILVPAVGLIGLDMGYGFDKVVPAGESKWEFHFSLGQNL